MKLQIILLWAAVGIYVASSFLYIAGLVFKRPKFVKSAGLAVWLGLVPHSVSIVLRWIQAGHGPYVDFYEVAGSDTWMALVLFLIARYKFPKLDPVGAVILPVSFLFLGLGVMNSPEITQVPDSVRTFWLVVHITFAKLAYGSFLIGTSLAAFQLLKERGLAKQEAAPGVAASTIPVEGMAGTAVGKRGGFLDSLPEPEGLDQSSYRFLAVGFFFLSIMILAGSIWANNIWGSYWNWDPMETWSLISWLIYGAYLHLRSTFGWRGRRASWFAIFAMAVLLFALFGVEYVYRTGHVLYLNRPFPWDK
ncbi:MAG: c-type cytochrome biogenesis protein CcsB [Firmicutes bacterium]|nr:c-type cytochrome biogenesis protein CcsB [Bacillota bacterium]